MNIRDRRKFLIWRRAHPDLLDRVLYEGVDVLLNEIVCIPVEHLEEGDFQREEALKSLEKIIEFKDTQKIPGAMLRMLFSRNYKEITNANH